MTAAPRYPDAPRRDHADVLHGQRVPDPYRWLEDPGDAETRRWLAGQDALWRERSARLLPGTDWFRSRLTELAAVGTVSAPAWRRGRPFQLRRAPGGRHPALYGDGRVLVDPDLLDPAGLTVLDAWQPDLEGGRLAYQLSRGGTERSELHVLDVATGRRLDGPIGGCRYSPVAWLPGGDAFFYVREGAVRLHSVGAAVGTDLEVLPARSGVGYGLEISADGRWLVVSAVRGTAPSNELWLADVHGAGPEGLVLRPVQREVAARSACAVGPDGRLYVVTDLDAPHIRLCVADPADPGVWRELVGPDPEAVLTGFTVLDGALLVARSRRSVAELTLHDAGTGDLMGSLALPGPGVVGPLTADGEGRAYFTYTDTVTPPTVWCYDHRTGGLRRWSGPDNAVVPPDVETRRTTCVSRDGTEVALTLIGRRWAGGPRPTILHGYGGFGVPLRPAFAPDALAWVGAGGVLALAHVRGGGEGGSASHRAGMAEHKQRVFDDFHAAAEHLVATGWTTTDRLALWGDSGGGLLVGAALTQRPELFAAAVCSAPLADMVRYEDTGLGALWTEEYGTVTDPEQFRRLLAYSPYHAVRAGVDYPATLLSVFGGDTRVAAFHAWKMCAALQWATRGDRPVLLRQEPSVGHGDRSADRAVALVADLLAFVAEHTGLRL